MRLNFTKMQSIGNDFVMLDLINQKLNLTDEIASKIADRHFGIGCDQIIVASEASWPGYDYCMRIFNADGSEVEQCGNGARCFARFLKSQGLIKGNSVKVHTANTPMQLELVSDTCVRASLSLPQFEPARLPFLVSDQAHKYSLKLKHGEVEIMAVSMGNPHAVIIVDDVDSFPVEDYGQQIQQHELFPKSVNVGFMQIISPSKLKLRVYERGAGETLGCGSGACAAVTCGIVNAGLVNSVDVQLPGGMVNVSWKEDAVWLEGETEHVFDGIIDL